MEVKIDICDACGDVWQERNELIQEAYRQHQQEHDNTSEGDKYWDKVAITQRIDKQLQEKHGVPCVEIELISGCTEILCQGCLDDLIDYLEDGIESIVSFEEKLRKET